MFGALRSNEKLKDKLKRNYIIMLQFNFNLWFSSVWVGRVKERKMRGGGGGVVQCMGEEGRGKTKNVISAIKIKTTV